MSHDSEAMLNWQSKQKPLSKYLSNKKSEDQKKSPPKNLKKLDHRKSPSREGGRERIKDAQRSKRDTSDQ